MLSEQNSQKAKLSSLLEAHAMMRAQDLREAGISVSTAEQKPATVAE
jgi:hypothetical protein